MILVALGANLPSPIHGAPRFVLEAALRHIEMRGLRLVARSRWYRTAPVPASDQPWYVNGAARIATDLSPAEVLAILHEIERDFGRVRQVQNEPRILDLDLLAYDDRVMAGPPALPHPRLHERAFVLLPLRDVAPDWRHPISGIGVTDLIDALPEGQEGIALAE